MSLDPKPLGLTALGSIGYSMTERREQFMIRAYGCGLTAVQVETLLNSDDLVAKATGWLGSAEKRLEYYAQHGYLTVLLGEVLSREELAGQPFSYWTVLNGAGWMDRPYARRFAVLGRDRQRGLVQAAIALTTELGGAEQGWPLERAMAAVMPYQEEA